MIDKKTLQEYSESINQSLIDIADAFDAAPDEAIEAINFTDESFRATIKIFSVAFFHKIWKLQEDENLDDDVRQAMAEKCGRDLRQLIKTYTNIDTKQL